MLAGVAGVVGKAVMELAIRAAPTVTQAIGEKLLKSKGIDVKLEPSTKKTEDKKEDKT
jgi:hypothetical protein